MGNQKLCDVHTKEKREVDADKTNPIIVEKWFKVKNRNVLFENRLDACHDCIMEIIINRARGVGVDFEKNWKTEVWQTGKTGKKYTVRMDMDEYVNFLEQQAKEEELAELRALRNSAK